MSVSDTIGLKITAYEELRAEAEALKAQLDEMNKRRDAMEAEVISAILDAQEETGVEALRINHAGRNYSVTVKTYYSIPKAQRDAAFELGGSGYPSVNFTCVTTSGMISRDEIILPRQGVFTVDSCKLIYILVYFIMLPL